MIAQRLPRRWNLGVPAFLLLAAASCFMYAANNIRTGGDKMSSVSNEDGGAVVALSIPATCRLGKPVILSLTIRNKGDARIVSGDYGYMPECRMELLDRDTQRAVEPTTEGKQFFGSRKDGSYAEVPLERGSERAWDIDLRRYFPLREGKFSLSVKVVLRKGEPEREFVVKAESLPFEIRK